MNVSWWTKTGKLKHVVMKIYTPQGQHSSIISFFDITKRKKAEAAFRKPMSSCESWPSWMN
ncbi:MAG: hypothetical protein R2860_07565 [Desulfobacterales bacterium]